MRIILAGGGTGGHITPNLAILENLREKYSTELKNERLEVLYIGSKKGMEKDLIPAAGWHFKGISCGKMRRYFDWENFLDFFRTIWGIWEAFLLVYNFQPDLIFCKGGYVSFPVAVAGWILRKKVVLHESDVVPGLANRLAAGFATLICVSFEASKKFFKGKEVVVTGNPVRKLVLAGSREKARKMTGFHDKKPVMLVMGGSQGAMIINQFIAENMQQILGKWHVIHLTGKGKSPELAKDQPEGYYSQEYAAEELFDFYALADLFVTRAGANSLAEIAALNKKAILIPLENGSRGDQLGNAEAFLEEYNGLVMTEKNLLIEEFLQGAENLLKMAESDSKKNNAAEILANLIIKNAKK